MPLFQSWFCTDSAQLSQRQRWDPDCLDHLSDVNNLAADVGEDLEEDGKANIHELTRLTKQNVDRVLFNVDFAADTEEDDDAEQVETNESDSANGIFAGASLTKIVIAAVVAIGLVVVAP